MVIHDDVIHDDVIHDVTWSVNPMERCVCLCVQFPFLASNASEHCFLVYNCLVSGMCDWMKLTSPYSNLCFDRCKLGV